MKTGNLDRRAFLESVATAAVGATGSATAKIPFDSARRHQRDFRATGALKRLSASLFVYEDCANVYIVRHGSRATLINFGTGDVLARLAEIGIDKVERVLVTHHHRDQVQGLADLKSYEFPVTVPDSEKRFFEDVESFWKNANIYIDYDHDSSWNTLRRSIRIAEKVHGGDAIDQNGIEFRVLDTPGATPGSVSYSAEIDGRRVVFTGDLIAGKGKVNNWFDLHWGYYGFTQGIDASERAFERVRGERPAWLLPSHGDPIGEPEAAMRENSRTYSLLRQMLPPNSTGRKSGETRKILPHLVYVGATSYAIVSETGKAFIYDYGYVDSQVIRKLKKEFGIRHVTVSFSHYHDDHLIRVYELLHGGTGLEVWSHESLVDVLQNPARYRLPCLVPFPIKVDRVIREGERVEWEGYTLEFFHMPGQTEFHQGMVTVIDGKKVMFTGDNTWKKADEQRIRNGPLVPQNEYFLDGGFITCASRMLRHMPDIVCPAHTEEYSPSKQDLEEFLGWAHRVRDVMDGLILQPDANFGMDYRWCHFYPFRHIASGGQEFEVRLVVRNHLFRAARIRVQLKLPDGLTCRDALRDFTIEPKTQVAVPFHFVRSSGYGRRAVVTADITFNGRRLGEVTEMVVE